MSKKLTMKEIECSMKDMEVEAALAYVKALEVEKKTSLEKLVQKYTKKKLALDKERSRFDEMCSYEKEARANGFKIIAGVDEAGRGPLAGPVVAAAVILPEDIFIPHLNDSKKLSPKQRDEIYDQIKEKAICYGIGISDHKSIDEINILNATKMAMKSALDSLLFTPDILLLDAVVLDDIEIEQVSIIKGDAKSISIAAASVLAKVTRDRMIEEADHVYPQYGFAKHKGYGTAEHIDAIKKYGTCPIHRLTFTKNFTAYIGGCEKSGSISFATPRV